MLRTTLGLGCFLLVQGLRAEDAQAAAKVKVDGFDLLGSVGYGFAFGEVKLDYAEPVEVNPYGVLVGADFGYTWRSGFRIGASASYGFGKAIEQTRRAPGSELEYQITTDTSGITAGPSLGYDLLLSSFRLRGTVEGGLHLWYDGGDSAAKSVYVAPGVALIWQHSAFELGLGSKYLFAAPHGLQFTLMSGARF